MRARVCAIIDIDGTLADCEHRRHHLETKDWTSFYLNMSEDRPNIWCVILTRAIAKMGVDVVLTTGRPEEYREATTNWLHRHGIEYSALFMRATKDYRKDCVVKEEILHRDIQPRWFPLFAVDDRKQVVDMWRKNYIVTLQCAEGDF